MKQINLKLDKKNCRDIDIYFIGYVDKEKPSDWKVNSVNPLYLIINRVFCFVGVSIDKRDVFSEIRCHIGNVSGECNFTEEEIAYDSEFNKVKLLSNDSLTVVIRCAFKQNGVYYPQVYLDDDFL